MKRRSDDLDKWIAILSKLAQSEDGIADDKKLGLSFYAIRSSTVGDYHKLIDILEDMAKKEFIEIVEDFKDKNNETEVKVVRYKITLKGIKTLFGVLIPARDALRGLDF